MWHRPLLLWTAAFVMGIGLGAAGLLPLWALIALAALGLAALALGRLPFFFLAGLLLLGRERGRAAPGGVSNPACVRRFARG